MARMIGKRVRRVTCYEIQDRDSFYDYLVVLRDCPEPSVPGAYFAVEIRKTSPHVGYTLAPRANRDPDLRRIKFGELPDHCQRLVELEMQRQGV